MSAGQKGTIPMFWHPQCSISLITASVLTLSLSTKFTLRLIGELKSAITSAQARMQEISKQKKAILVYRRTKDVYTQYRESGWSPAFYREHKADIDAHKEAQAVYSAAGGKLPTLSELSEEYNLLLSQKKQAGEQLSHLNDELKNLRHIKLNMDTLLDDERFEEGQTQRMRDAEPEHEQHTTGKDR